MVDSGILKIESMKNRCTPAEWQARVDLAACYRLVDIYGMSDMMANHVSCSVPGEEGAFLINAARGGVVNEPALIDALKSQHIKAAGLDVFVDEPKPSVQILMNPHVSLTPHIGAATVEAQARIGLELAEQIMAKS